MLFGDHGGGAVTFVTARFLTLPSIDQLLARDRRNPCCCCARFARRASKAREGMQTWLGRVAEVADSSRGLRVH